MDIYIKLKFSTSWPNLFCYFRCPKYTNIPGGCNLVVRNGECCPKIQCSNGVFLTSAVNSHSLGGGGGIQVINQGGNFFPVPTLPGGYVQGGGAGTGIMPPTIGKHFFKHFTYIYLHCLGVVVAIIIW